MTLVVLSSVRTGRVVRKSFRSLESARRFARKFRPTALNREGWRVELFQSDADGLSARLPRGG